MSGHKDRNYALMASHVRTSFHHPIERLANLIPFDDSPTLSVDWYVRHMFPTFWHYSNHRWQ
jgi:hypothetical protein